MCDLIQNRKNGIGQRIGSVATSSQTSLIGQNLPQSFTLGSATSAVQLSSGQKFVDASCEFPDEKAATSAVLAAAAGGSLSDVETTVAMTAKDAATTFESAGKAAREFRSAGRS